MSQTLPAPINAASLADKVRERIQSTILDLIPQEQLDQLVVQSVNSFTQAQADQRDYHGNRTRDGRSQLELLVERIVVERLEKEVKVKMDALFDWNGASTQLFQEVVDRTLTNPDNVNMMLKGLASSILLQARAQMGMR